MHTWLITCLQQPNDSLEQSARLIPYPRLDPSWRGFYFAYYFAGPTRALHARSLTVS